MRTTAAELRAVFGRLLRDLEAHGVDTTGWALSHSAYGTPKRRITNEGRVVLPLGDTASEAWWRMDLACRVLGLVEHAQVPAPLALPDGWNTHLLRPGKTRDSQ